MTTSPGARTLRFFRYFAGAYPGRTAIMAALLAASGVLEGIGIVALLPLLELAAPSDGAAASDLGDTVRGVLEGVGIEPTMPVLVVLIIGSIALKALLLWAAMRQVGFTVSRVTLDLRVRLLRALLDARWSFLGDQHLGEVVNGLGREATAAATAYREACVVVSGLLLAAVYLLVSALISWQITLLALVSGIALAVGLRYFVEMGRSAGESGMRLTRNLAAQLVDGVQGMKPLKAMAREEWLEAVLLESAEGLRAADRRAVMAAESLRLFQEPVVALVLASGLYVLLTATQSPFTSVMVLAFVFYRLMSQVNQIQIRYHLVVAGEAMFWSLLALITDAEAAREDRSGSRPVTGLSEAIELRDVTFRHGDLTVLDAVTMRVPARAVTALTGASGSGKSTVLDLISGLRRPTLGEVYVDGVPLGEIALDSWRARIGYVPQEVFLLHDTVRRNITLGDDTISEAQLEQALRDSGSWEFTSRLPEGADTVVLPQGSNLSGGQRQRLAIARALVRSPVLLILDEATSGLDTATEQDIMETLARLRGRVSVLAVSHHRIPPGLADVSYHLSEGKARTTNPAT